MMNDVVMTFVVVIVLGLILAALASRNPPSMRPWIWFAFAEYLAAAASQQVYARVIVDGGDTLLYARTGADLARFLDANFSWASREMLSLLFQQPSAFDNLAYAGGQNNTGSMCAATAWLMYFLNGSDVAAQVCVAGMSLIGALSIYRAFRDAYAPASPIHLFVATVLFPSVAFWTSALHKEAFCVAGIGAVLAAWRALYRRRWIAFVVWAPLGMTMILLFRAPAIPPLALGLVIYFLWKRLQSARGADIILLSPIYFGVALAVLAGGMVALTTVAPKFGLDTINETVATTQRGWALTRAGSTFGTVEEAAPQTLGAQLTRVPLAVVNALFRPQLFDVHNFGALLSALEMSFITWLILRAIRLHGLRGILSRVQRSPFLMMCTVVMLVGCTFVGLVTFNFGSLARYRVPFLPFYGALIVALSARTLAETDNAGATAEPEATRAPARPRIRRHRNVPRSAASVVRRL